MAYSFAILHFAMSYDKLSFSNICHKTITSDVYKERKLVRADRGLVDYLSTGSKPFRAKCSSRPLRGNGNRWIHSDVAQILSTFYVSFSVEWQMLGSFQDTILLYHNVWER